MPRHNRHGSSGSVECESQVAHQCETCGRIIDRGDRSEPVVANELDGAALVYTVREAAEQLRIGYSTARECIRTGELRSFKVGRRRLVAGEDLVAYVRAQVDREVA
jgi:excisionase family DNA binding protein